MNYKKNFGEKEENITKLSTIKVLLIISIICCAICFITTIYFLINLTIPSKLIEISLILCFIVIPLSIIAYIISVIAYKKVNTASISEIQSFGVVVLFFCNVIAGVLMICVTDEDINR